MKITILSLLLAVSFGIFQGSGKVVIDPNLPRYPSGTVVKLTAVPDNNGTYFDGFTDANGNLITRSPEMMIIMDSNKSYLAWFFEKALKITDRHTNGNITRLPSKTSYLFGDKVTLTAIPDPNYKFSRWTRDAQGFANPTTIVMDANKVVEAVFVPIEKPQEFTLEVQSIRGVIGKQYSMTTTLNLQGIKE